MKIQIYFCFFKKFWWLIAAFEIKEELKHVYQLKYILTKHTNMAYINCEQDHNENQAHINKNHAMNNVNISNNRKEK